MFDLFVPETYRVVYNQDVVVTVPKFLFYYKHVGVEVTLQFNFAEFSCNRCARPTPSLPCR